MRSRSLACLLAAVALAAAAPASGSALVVCAPGFPGDTMQAQPTLDAFARAAAKAAGWKEGLLTASYQETESGGLARLGQQDAVLALVTLPFFAKHRTELRLEPRLEAIGASGAALESWTLVAKRGAVTSAASLDGWEVTGVAGYAPAFVRDTILGEWGRLPESTRITFTSRIPSALLKAASGQKLAVLLDAEQTKALPSLPSAAELEVVASSKPLPPNVLCTVGGHGGSKDVESLLRALPRLHERREGAEALAAMRLARFAPLDPATIASLLRSSSAAPGPGK